MSKDREVQKIVDKVCNDYSSDDDYKEYEEEMEQHIKNDPAFKKREHDSKMSNYIISKPT